MKHCPSCNFTFPDFHIVCDFDGTELVPDPDRLALMSARKPSRLCRLIKSPMFLTIVAVTALFVSAVTIGYYESSNEVAPVVKAHPDGTSSADAITVAQLSDQPSTQIKKQKAMTSSRSTSSLSSIKSTPSTGHASFVSTRRPLNTRTFSTPRPMTARASSPAASSSTVAQLNPRNSSEGPRRTEVALRTTGFAPRRTEVARYTPSEQPEKERKLTAVLKTTWRVISKPFKF